MEYKEYRDLLMAKTGIEPNISKIAKATNHSREYVAHRLYGVRHKVIGQAKCYYIDDVAKIFFSDFK